MYIPDFGGSGKYKAMTGGKKGRDVKPPKNKKPVKFKEIKSEDC